MSQRNCHQWNASFFFLPGKIQNKSLFQQFGTKTHFTIRWCHFNVGTDGKTGQFKLTGTVMRLHDKYDINPPSSAPSVFTFSRSDRLVTVPWKPIMPSMNVYCSDSASQTLKYENSDRERGGGPVPDRPGDWLTVTIVLFLNVSPTTAEVCEDRRCGGGGCYLPCCND